MAAADGQTNNAHRLAGGNVECTAGTTADGHLTDAAVDCQVLVDQDLATGQRDCLRRGEHTCRVESDGRADASVGDCLSQTARAAVGSCGNETGAADRVIFGVAARVEVSVTCIGGGDGAQAGGVQNQRALTGSYRRTASFSAAAHRYGDIARRRTRSRRIHCGGPLNRYRLTRRRRIGIVRCNRRRGISLVHGMRCGRR